MLSKANVELSLVQSTKTSPNGERTDHEREARFGGEILLAREMGN